MAKDGWVGNTRFELGVEDASEQDKKPECYGPRGTSSKVIKIMMMMRVTIVMMNMMVKLKDQHTREDNNDLSYFSFDVGVYNAH